MVLVWTLKEFIGHCYVYSSLEDCLAAQGCAGVETLRRDLERTAAELQRAKTCEVNLKAELVCHKER